MDNAYEIVILGGLLLTAMIWTDLRIKLKNTFKNVYFEVLLSGFSKQA